MAKQLSDRLIALGAKRLTEVLLELADRDLAIEKRLMMLTATNSESIKKIRSQISGLKRIKRFYDWKSVGQLSEKIELILEGIGRLKIDPKKGFELVSSFYETDTVVCEHCDDSTGTIGILYRCDAKDLLTQFGHQCHDKSWLAERVFELNKENGYGIRDGILTAACEFLPEADVRLLVNRYCELASKADKEFNSTESEPQWNRPSRRYWGAAAELAAGICDAPLYEMAYKSDWGDQPLNSAGWIDVAKVYLLAGDPQTALLRLSNVDDTERFRRDETQRLRIQAHKTIGSKANLKKVFSILRDRLFESPSVRTLTDLKEFADPSEYRPIVDKLSSRYLSDVQLNLSFLELLLVDSDVSIAEEYLLERADLIDGERYGRLVPIAKSFTEKKSSLAATLILRALADSILRRAVSKNYKIAVGYINRASKLAADIADWKNHIDHAAYLETLRTNHARKSAFWSKMD